MHYVINNFDGIKSSEESSLNENTKPVKKPFTGITMKKGVVLCVRVNNVSITCYSEKKVLTSTLRSLHRNSLCLLI